MPMTTPTSSRPSHLTRLTYYIFEGLLVGFAGGKLVHIPALSGGRGGTTTKGAETDAVNNPYMTGLTTTTHFEKGKEVHSATDTHGGPIPPGEYRIAKPGIYKTKSGHEFMAAQLTATHPIPGKKHRDGFLIHGAGSHGSDGCIVPLNKASFNNLMSLLSNDAGGTLQVLEAMGGGFA